MTKVYNLAARKQLRQQLRRSMPEAEILLWSRLRGRKILCRKFQRQYSVGPYVIDLYCPECKLAIEIDGDTHNTDEAREYDEERQAFVEAFGIQFLRFTNNQVYRTIDDVVRQITGKIVEIEKNLSSPSPC
jgi:very-short-patch-repair endonuclease